MTEQHQSEIVSNAQEVLKEPAPVADIAAAPEAAECGFTLIEAQGIASDIIALMGGCFILGSFVTVFCLLILDFIRRNKPEQ